MKIKSTLLLFMLIVLLMLLFSCKSTRFYQRKLDKAYEDIELIKKERPDLVTEKVGYDQDTVMLTITNYDSVEILVQDTIAFDNLAKEYRDLALEIDSLENVRNKNSDTYARIISVKNREIETLKKLRHGARIDSAEYYFPGNLSINIANEENSKLYDVPFGVKIRIEGDEVKIDIIAPEQEIYIDNDLSIIELNSNKLWIQDWKTWLLFGIIMLLVIIRFIKK